MSPIVTYILLLFMGLYALVVLVELALSHAIKPFLVQVTALAALFALLNLTTGFPQPKRAFGGVSPITAIGLMFLCTLLGIAAHYIFFLKGGFSWASFLKPLVISPLVLLPLIGSVQGASRVESIQLISFGFLAFQNGFFWKVVLKHATTQISTGSDVAGPPAD